MTSLTDDNCMQIPKLKGAKNYRPWAIDVQAALKSRNIWKIITGTKVVPIIPAVSASEALKALYTSSVQQHASAKGIFILSIDPFILIDKCTICSAKKI